MIFNLFFREIEEIKFDYPIQANNMLDMYTELTFLSYELFNEQDKVYMIKEYKNFYNNMNWEYPTCLKRE